MLMTDLNAGWETISQMQFIHLSFAIYACHFERSEKPKVGNRFAGNDFRFLTAFGMTTLGIYEIVSG